MANILKNEPTATLRVAAPIPFYDLDGQLLTGQTFLTASGEVKTYTLAGGWVAAANNATALGAGGNHSYQFTQAETNDDTIIGVQLIKAGYSTQFYWSAIVETAGGLSAAATAAAVWGAVRASYVTAGTFGQGVASVQGAVTSVAAGGIAAGVIAAGALTEIGTACWASVLEGTHTAGDLMRGMIGQLVGKVTDYTTGTLVFKSLNAAKTRWTITTNSTGRLTVTPGDLT